MYTNDPPKVSKFTKLFLLHVDTLVRALNQGTGDMEFDLMEVSLLLTAKFEVFLKKKLKLSLVCCAASFLQHIEPRELAHSCENSRCEKTYPLQGR